MGLALLIVILKSLALYKRDEFYSNAARFWARIFALKFDIPASRLCPRRAQFQRLELQAFLASGLSLLGMLTSAAFGVFPNVLRSNIAPAFSLTIYNAATPEHGLIVGLCWFIPSA
jgi:cytochrome bd-type quinol oxidase subunit 2